MWGRDGERCVRRAAPEGVSARGRPAPASGRTGTPTPRNSVIQPAVSPRTSSPTSSANPRSTPRQRSAASAAVPSAGPSTSRTLSAAQSNWSVRSLRCTACAVATSRIHPEVTPKKRSPATHAAPSSSARYAHGTAPSTTPARSSSGSIAPHTPPAAAPARSSRAPRRLPTRSARYQATVSRAPRSTHRYSSCSRSAGSPQSPCGNGRPARSAGQGRTAPSPRPLLCGPSGCVPG